MSKRKHTPGPWVIEANQGKRGSWIGHLPKDGRLQWAALACGETDEEGCANARLIAAAPQLLEAGNRVLHSYPTLTGEMECVVVAKSDLDALRAAIAAATGEAQ